MDSRVNIIIHLFTWERNSYTKEEMKCRMTVGGLVIICLTTLSVPLGMTFIRLSKIRHSSNDSESSDILFGSKLGGFKRAAVSSESAPCSAIGK